MNCLGSSWLSGLYPAGGIQDFEKDGVQKIMCMLCACCTQSEHKEQSPLVLDQGPEHAKGPWKP